MFCRSVVSFIDLKGYPFQTGTSLEDVGYTMNDHTGNSDVGDVFAFDVTVDLPHISEATDIKMEIFALDPNVGIAGFTLCNVQPTSFGGNISPDMSANPPKITTNTKEGFDGVVEKVIIEAPGVTTSGPDAGENNKIKIAFDAMMVPLPEVTVC